jgi:hypothetical protein
VRFLKLASNWLDRKEGDEFTWPYWVDLSVSGAVPKVAFAEGVAHGSAGGAFSVSDALSERWHRHLESADALWLRPYFARLVEGMPVTEAELIEAFRARHGRAPEAYDWDLPE